MLLYCEVGNSKEKYKLFRFCEYLSILHVIIRILIGIYYCLAPLFS